MNLEPLDDRTMKPRLIIAVGILFLCTVALYATGFLGSSPERVTRDHSVALPSSASHIRCGGLFSITTFGDFDADTSFEVAAADLPAVLSQFTWQPDVSDASIKSLGERMVIPPPFVRPDAMRWGRSRDGNTVYFQNYALGAGRIGVCIYTIWN